MVLRTQQNISLGQYTKYVPYILWKIEAGRSLHELKQYFWAERAYESNSKLGNEKEEGPMWKFLRTESPAGL